MQLKKMNAVLALLAVGLTASGCGSGKTKTTQVGQSAPAAATPAPPPTMGYAPGFADHGPSASVPADLYTGPPAIGTPADFMPKARSRPTDADIQARTGKNLDRAALEAKAGEVKAFARDYPVKSRPGTFTQSLAWGDVENWLNSQRTFGPDDIILRIARGSDATGYDVVDLDAVTGEVRLSYAYGGSAANAMVQRDTAVGLGQPFADDPKTPWAE